MVKILIFVPKLDMQEQFERVVKSFGEFPDIKIELTHIFGTPESLACNRDAEIMVARGMTCDRLRVLFPKKHIIEIQLTSYNIVNALIRSRDEHQPKRIALCVHKMDIQYIGVLEELCQAKIDTYDVWDQESAEAAINAARVKDTDVYVGAGTVCGLCDRQNLPRVHIKTRDDAVETALAEAINTAHTINRERASYSTFRTIINNNSDGIITIDTKGIIQQINNQAYQFFHVSTVDDVKGHSINIVNKHFKWKQAMEDQGALEEVLQVGDEYFFVQYKPIFVESINTGLVIIIRNSKQIAKEETKIRRSLGEKGLTAKYNFTDIIGRSSGIQDNIRMANRFSQVDSNVLIIGETGTGKELFAHSIHNASKRSNEPFVALNCAALPENLLESELFGYVGGAFSGASKNGKIGLFELAHKGTIFLDEIGEIPITLQAKLLRVLQEKEIRRIGADSVQPIDVRVISATNIEIEKQIEEGHFRSDLYYRLNLLDILIPPLRERKEDIQEMVDFYLNKFSCDMKKSPAQLTKEAAKILTEYYWPGNVRELRNICERLVVLNDTDEITLEDLMQFKIFREKAKSAPIRTDNLEEQLLQLAPKKTKQDIARELGVSRTTLWRMMKQQEAASKKSDTE